MLYVCVVQLPGIDDEEREEPEKVKKEGYVNCVVVCINFIYKEEE